MPDRTVQIQLTGREAETRLPPLLTPATRSAGRVDDVFLPTGYLVATRAFDVSPAARGAADATAKQAHDAGPNEVIVLELADGSTLITSAERLRATLLRTHPDLIGEDGSILLEKLRADGAAPGRGFGEALGGLISKVYAFAVGAAPDAIIDEALGQIAKKAELGVSWAGTKALMWAIEKRLDQQPGLYRWVGASGKPSDLEVVDLNGPNEPVPTPGHRCWCSCTARRRARSAASATCAPATATCGVRSKRPSKAASTPSSTARCRKARSRTRSRSRAHCRAARRSAWSRTRAAASSPT